MQNFVKSAKRMFKKQKEEKYYKNCRVFNAMDLAHALLIVICCMKKYESKQTVFGLEITRVNVYKSLNMFHTFQNVKSFRLLFQLKK